MKIRNYTDTDYNYIISIWQTVLPDTKPHNKPQTSLEKKLKSNDGLLLLAEEDNKIIGTAMGGYDGHRGWIYSVAVLPDYRRKGIARKLLKELERKLTELGCLKVNLQVRATNSDVILFYKKCGFEIEEIISMGKRLY